MVSVMYDRQASLGIYSPEEVSIIGCGGIGAWVAIDLAMTGTEKVNLFDSDDLEAHNLNRLPFTLNDIGKPKVEVLKKYIENIRPDADVKPSHVDHSPCCSVDSCSHDVHRGTLGPDDHVVVSVGSNITKSGAACCSIAITDATASTAPLRRR